MAAPAVSVMLPIQWESNLMSEYELLDIYYTANDSLAAYIMNFVSILSGYLLATYFLGKRITKSQFLILTLSYLAIKGITIMGIYVRNLELIGITSQIDSLEMDWWMSFRAETESMAILMCAHMLILAGSLYFGFSSVQKIES